MDWRLTGKLIAAGGLGLFCFGALNDWLTQLVGGLVLLCAGVLLYGRARRR